MKTKNIIIIIIIIAIILILIGNLYNTGTKYATIKGESFTIPKIEGDYYYEK